MGVDDIFQDMENFGKGRFSKWLWKCFGFAFGELLKYPQMDTTSCGIKDSMFVLICKI